MVCSSWEEGRSYLVALALGFFYFFGMSTSSIPFFLLATTVMPFMLAQSPDLMAL